ncbi:3-hydroxyisobutyrate dehydrogenase [Dyadobacter koreensis]|uniref:3-hydroxyisobutyrate dehydrogenase n=2 Tax=Dyadobacter koreensis TaxID=408657 RepID=A0A1H6XSK8_9BACT|nr:3-hydroxyisobutyrate dehydrogenase [Dyadobacter koreensis]
MSTIKIGWIGLGKMGVPMAENLIKSGLPVSVYNRNKAKEEELLAKGAQTAPSPAALIEQSDVVIVMVSDDRAIHAVFLGEDGLLSAKTSGKTIINMSTVSSAISREMSILCSNQNNHYLDAPVSGSVKQAESAQLVIMVGGEENVYENVKEILEKLGKLTLLVGGAGAGNAAKLAVNSMIGFYTQGLSEAILFAKKNDIKIDDFLTIINNGALANVYTKTKGDAILNNNFEPAFYLKHIYKDLGLARDQGLDTPLGEAAYESFRQAEKTLGDEDLIAIIKHLDSSK